MTKILAVVDDNEAARAIIRRAILRVVPGAVILEAADGRQALEVIARERPERVFLDLDMPIMHGRDVLRWLRKSEYQPPVIVLTSSIAEADHREALELGAVACFSKPTRMAALVEIVRLGLAA